MTDKEALNAEIVRRSRELDARTPAPGPLPESPSAYEGKPNRNSNKTLEKLRGLTNHLSAQLTEARQAHVVKITTIATELVDAQRDQIQELEKEIERLEVANTELTQRLNGMVINHPAVTLLEQATEEQDAGHRDHLPGG